MTVKVWGVVEGPINIDETGQRDEDTPDDAMWYMVCKTEIEGKIEDVNFWFEDLDDAYEWEKHFATKIEPLEVREDL